MIVTLTMNPALDRTVTLTRPLAVGAVQSAESAREDAAGKGVNVARVLRGAGAEVLAVLPLAADDPYARLSGDLPLRAVPVAAHARANLAITDPDGETTKINLPGPGLTRGEADALIDVVVAAADAADWLALCGSLPPGVGPDFYLEVIEAVRDRASRPPRIAVDTSGDPLMHVVAHGHVDLIKPNEDELADLLSKLHPARGDAALDPAAPSAEQQRAALDGLRHRLRTQPVPTAAELAAFVVPLAVGAALVTLGGDGAVLVTGDGAWHAGTPPVDVRSTVGAGDSALAGYLLADLAGEDPPGRLRSAIAYGSATAALPGTQLATPADLAALDIATGAIPVRPIA
ncbi:1-phosphofructokinase family hexose kinase [Microbacterium album]|uniref:1-phosphofructokinase n=1 Tax=Microbacterium album TaxID=2053191 RepID=A0A917ML63_9MICO|nr:1-phosphofructokinase family hexose kinase [Microbacterium album]GGH36288.1 1-phosphofructokinase [Microbacterium album]